MNRTLLVLKNEFLTTVSRRSFLITLFLLPLAAFIIMMIVSGLQRTEAGTQVAQMFGGQTEENLPQGYVDLSGIVVDEPAEIADELTLFSDETSANAALTNGEIKAYYIIHQDFLETGRVDVIRPDFNPLDGFEQSGSLESLLNYNLLGGDAEQFARVENPVDMQTEYLSTAPQRDPNSSLTFFIPYAVTMLFYTVILSSATLMLNSITTEKQNRVIEILLTSINPVKMLTGKIIALGLVGLMQTIVWSITGFLLLRLSGRAFSLPTGFQLPFSLVLYGILFFLLGFALYASLMAGIGALVPNLREASQATTIIIGPMVIPLMFISALVQEPNGTLAVILSIFPLTSPVSMMTRLAATQVPFWQILLSSALLLGSAIIIVRSVAGLFRAQNLLSGQSFQIKYFFKALLGHA